MCTAPVLVLDKSKMQHGITCSEHLPDEVFVSVDFVIKKKRTSGLKWSILELIVCLCCTI